LVVFANPISEFGVVRQAACFLAIRKHMLLVALLAVEFGFLCHTSAMDQPCELASQVWNYQHAVAPDSILSLGGHIHTYHLGKLLCVAAPLLLWLLARPVGIGCEEEDPITCVAPNDPHHVCGESCDQHREFVEGLKISDGCSKCNCITCRQLLGFAVWGLGNILILMPHANYKQWAVCAALNLLVLPLWCLKRFAHWLKMVTSGRPVRPITQPSTNSAAVTELLQHIKDNPSEIGRLSTAGRDAVVAALG